MKKFKKVYIEITNICNLACEFCPKTRRPAQFMSAELFENIIKDIKGHAKHLYFHVMGEPLLHPDLGLFLDLCHEQDYRVNITTNGTLIGKVADLIVKKPALRQVNFSLHSIEANKEQYSMDIYLDDIFEFVRKARKIGKISISLRLWNLSERGKNKENSYILRRIEKQFGLGFAIEDELTPCNGLKLAEGVFLNQAAVFDWPDIMRNEISETGFCHGLRDQLAVLVDGTVVPCCLDGEGIIKLGNIKEQKLDEIIQGSRAREIYEGFSRRQAVEELCKKCGYRGRFGS